MIYWLMSLNKEKVRLHILRIYLCYSILQNKKLGPFVPFKDFKGNSQEAINKITGDLKKFGYSNAKNMKPDQLKLVKKSLIIIICARAMEIPCAI